MPPVIAFVAAVGAGAAAAVGITIAGAAAFAVGAAIIVGGTMLVTKLATPKLSQGVNDNDSSRQVTARGTIESQKIIYGEALVSGPLAFVGVSGTGNKNLHHVVALAGHQVEAITEIWLDDQVITSAQIGVDDWVASGTFAPLGGEPIVKVSKYLGTADQVADIALALEFGGYTIFHRGRGIANIATTFVLNDDSQELWDKYSPSNIKALVKGRNQVYDPRLDTSPGANPTSATYQAWTDNPALCVTDYLLNTKFGMKINPAKIDWDEVVVAANACDVLVDIPGPSTQKRFTANGVIFATDKHQTSINKLLSSMNGTLVYTSGTYVLRAGVYEAPTESLGEDDLTGPITVKTSVERSDRFNTCGGVFIDPSKQHKSVEFPKVQLTAALNRDNGEVLEREIDLPFTNSDYMAQRIAHKLVQLSDQQKIISFPCNLSGLRVAVGDRVNVTISDFGWTNKVFRCMAWAFSDDGGVDLTLAEDDAGSYADPAIIEYSVTSPAGVIVEGFPGVPDPQNLVAVAGIKSIDLNWVNPANVSKFDSIIIYAAPTSAWAGAVEIGRGIMTTFKHDASTSADPITNGDARWYWVRAIGTGASGSVLSDRNPDNDTSTVTATAALNQAQLVEWAVVADSSGLRPENNATVGAQLSIDLKNQAGVVLADTDVLNSIVIEDITQIQLAGTGDILELIGGQPADLQQLGDVAAYAFDADLALKTSIDLLDTSVVNLGSLLTDITSGVGDVYVQAAAPVAGVGGVPDPIVTSSRWYDSDDNNAPYYWSGVAWVSLQDPRIASNQADITLVAADLATTQTTVGGHTTSIGANANAISVLDATVISLDGSLTALSGSFDSFVASYEASDPIAGVFVNSAAIAAIDVRVTVAEGSITASATDITELTSSVQNYVILEGTDGNPLEFVGGGDIDLQGTSAVGGAVGTAVSVLDTRVTENDEKLVVQSSSIVSLTAALADLDLGIAGNATAISGLSTVVELQGDIITASAADLVTLTARVGTAEGELTQLNTVSIGSTSALVQSHLALTGSVGTAQGQINQINTVDVSSTSALVQAHLAVSSTVGSNTTSISTQQTSINGIHANYSVKIDNNGRVTGFGLTSTVANAVPTSAFYIVADKFAVVDPASTGDAPIVPFSVSAGLITMGTNVRISGDLVTTGTINANRISIDGVTLDTDGLGNLIIAADGVGTSQIAPSAVTINELADTIQSTNYVTGVSGWRITKAGASEFSDVVVRGNVDAGSISINGDYLQVVGGALTVIKAPPQEAYDADEVTSPTGTGTSSVTINRVAGGLTTIEVNVRIFEVKFGTYTSPFPATLTLKRGATVIASFSGIQGEWAPGDGGGEPALAAGSFGATFYDSDTGTGSTTYNLTCTTSSFNTSFQIIARSTIP